MRVELGDLPGDHWEHFLRARDLNQVFSDFSGRIDRPLLEIGCGDGYVTTLLRRRFAQVVPMDLRPRGRVDGLCIASAELLPFRDGYFGVVFSSNVLEHVEDLPACMQEMRRVMRDDGIMIHTMPTPTWKALQLTLYPLHVLLHIALPKIAGRSNRVHSSRDLSTAHPSGSVAAGSSKRKSGRSRLRSLFLASVHGTAQSHREELARFRVKWWIDQFTNNGFEVVRTAPLYLHSAYRFFPYRALALRERISRGGLSVVHAYWVRKVL